MKGVENAADKGENVALVYAGGVSGSQGKQADSGYRHYGGYKNMGSRTVVKENPGEKGNQNHINCGKKGVFSGGGKGAADCLTDITKAQKAACQDSVLKVRAVKLFPSFCNYDCHYDACKGITQGNKIKGSNVIQAVFYNDKAKAPDCGGQQKSEGRYK